MWFPWPKWTLYLNLPCTFSTTCSKNYAFANAPYRHPQYFGLLIIMYVLRYNIAPQCRQPAGRNKNRAADVFPISMIGLLGDNWELNWITDAFFARKSGSLLMLNATSNMWGINLGPNRLFFWKHISVKTYMGILHLAGVLREHCNCVQYFWDIIQESITLFAKKIWYLIALHCITFVFVKNDGRERIISLSAKMNEWCMIRLLKQEKTLCPYSVSLAHLLAMSKRLRYE